MRLVSCLVAACLSAACLSASGLAETRALVVAGLGGGPDYAAGFQRAAESSAEHLRAVAADVVLVTGDAASRQRLQDTLSALASRSAPTDQLVVMLIGHGTYDERDYRFNVPGADVTGAELAAWLEAVPARRQLVVAATSASGALQPLLKADQRTVITATRSGGERNATVFARYFAEAMEAGGADTDKDGYVSGAEAFRFAEAGVAKHYEQRQQMATEHPLRQGEGSPLMLARLATPGGFQPLQPADRDRLAALEREIAVLRADKDRFEPDAYYAELQRLLLQVAMLRRQLEEGGGR